MTSFHSRIVHPRLRPAITTCVPAGSCPLIQRRKPETLFVFLQKIINFRKINNIEGRRKEGQSASVDFPELLDLDRKGRIFLFLLRQQIITGCEEPGTVMPKCWEDPACNHRHLIRPIFGVFAARILHGKPFQFDQENLQQGEECLYVDTLKEDACIRDRLLCIFGQRLVNTSQYPTYRWTELGRNLPPRC